MSGLSLYLTAGTAPNGSQLPANTQALINFIASYVGIGGGGSFNGVNYGTNTPAPQNRGLPWYKTDSSGNPVGFFAWNGSAWVTAPTNVANGPTSTRPVSPSNGATYYDTTIGTTIIWNAAANNWTTLSGSVGDLKEVTASTLAIALTNNPGWQQHTASSGCVIGAASDTANGPATAHPQGTLVGEELHVLSVSELATHQHAEIYGTFPGQFQNGTQGAGIFPAVTPGGSAITPANTVAAGSNSGHNNLQPTFWCYRLVKTY